MKGEPQVFASWDLANIMLPRRGSKAFCPSCHATRKHKSDRSLSVDTERGLFNCHNPGCDFHGRINDERYQTFRAPVAQRYESPPAIVPEVDLLPWSVAHMAWLQQRGISDEVAKRNGVVTNPENEAELVFPVMHLGQHINTQYRDTENRKRAGKGFRMVTGAAPGWYGLDDVVTPVTGAEPDVAETWIIVEGPMDMLAIETATGFRNVISVMNGADTKLDAVLPPIADYLPKVKRFILAGDIDQPHPETGKTPGQDLMNELSRRLGKERCWRVRWPEGCKDANDTLMRHGPDAVWRALNNATPEPVEGIIRLNDLYDDVLRLRYGTPELGVPFLPGNVGQSFRIDRGFLLTMSGSPGSGKSRVMDNVMVGTAIHQEWRWLVCSPESWPPQLHAKHLIQIESGLPLHEMSPQQIEAALDRLKSAITLVRPETMSVKAILETMTKGMLSTGCDGILLDPWNRLGHRQPAGQILANYVGEVVETIKNFGVRHGVFTGLVAHPRKPESGREDADGYLMVRPYDIADSHAFYDMSDFIVTVARNKNDELAATKLLVAKVKTEEYGDIGEHVLYYDKPTGRLRDEPWR